MGTGSRAEQRGRELKAMAARMTPDTLHGEVDTGFPQGKEKW